MMADATVSSQDGGNDNTSTADKSHRIGHMMEQKPRTQDIRLDENLSFSDLGLGPELIKGLSRSGFEKPSPIQLAAIPYGRCGLDLVVQAKSGTGKTCVFTIIALESIDIKIRSPQVLMLTPTREIALQVEEVVKAIGCELQGLHCHCSIGGLSIKDDKNRVKRAHIVIGTPGRVKQLMELSALNASSMRLFVLDEADKLLEDSFQEQINWIYSGLPGSKQVIAASATYKEEIVQHLCNYMHNPTFVRLNSNDPVLLGVRQYKKQVASGHLPNEIYDNKVSALTDILSQCHFQQCLVFSNLMTRAENLSKLMVSRGWPTTHIAGSLEQDERMKAINRLKSYDCRILISTDLTSRGIDADRIDLVINLDLPYDCETYLHRVGRAGRFGSNGAAVTLYTQAESHKLDKIAQEIDTSIQPLSDELPVDFIHNPTAMSGEEKKLVQVETFQIITEKSKKCTSERNTADSRKQESADEKSKVETFSHRPPFQSLGDAVKFLKDPSKRRAMLDTNIYMKHSTQHSNNAQTLSGPRSSHISPYGFVLGEQSTRPVNVTADVTRQLNQLTVNGTHQKESHSPISDAADGILADVLESATDKPNSSTSKQAVETFINAKDTRVKESEGVATNKTLPTGSSNAQSSIERKSNGRNQQSSSHRRGGNNNQRKRRSHDRLTDRDQERTWSDEDGNNSLQHIGYDDNDGNRYHANPDYYHGHQITDYSNYPDNLYYNRENYHGYHNHQRGGQEAFQQNKDYDGAANTHYQPYDYYNLRGYQQPTGYSQTPFSRYTHRCTQSGQQDQQSGNTSGDAVRRALNTHYRQVFFQYSYIRGMARQS